MGDGMIPAYGFGAKIPPHNTVSHCFPLNFSSNPEVRGVPGLLNAYNKCLDQVTLYGPTNFASIIDTGIQIARQYQNGQNYLVMLIITDGEMTDMDRTIEKIIE